MHLTGELHLSCTPLRDRCSGLEGIWIVSKDLVHFAGSLEVELVCGSVVGTGERCEVGGGHENFVQPVIFGPQVGDLISGSHEYMLPPGELRDSPHPPPAPGRPIIGELYIKVALTESLP